MKYAVDRIEGELVVLENIETNEIINIPLSTIPMVKEQDIVVFENGIYRIDDEEKNKILLSIQERMRDLKGDE